MPPFNPAMIGAPSPVGRGGASGVSIGSIILAKSRPDLTYQLCDGSFFDASGIPAFPLALYPQPGSGGTTITAPGNCFGTAYGNGITVGVFGNFSASWSADDGDNWAPVSLGTYVGINITGIGFANGVFFIFADQGFYQSTDGKNFTRNAGMDRSPTEVVYGNGRWIFCSGTLVYVTTDLVNFASYNVGISINSLAFNGTVFICSGINGGNNATYIYYSPNNGQSWPSGGGWNDGAQRSFVRILNGMLVLYSGRYFRSATLNDYTMAAAGSFTKDLLADGTMDSSISYVGDVNNGLMTIGSDGSIVAQTIDGKSFLTQGVGTLRSGAKGGGKRVLFGTGSSGLRAFPNVPKFSRLPSVGTQFAKNGDVLNAYMKAA